MAIAAARAAVNARIQRKKLLQRTKSLTESTLDKKQRAHLVENLEKSESTMFLIGLTEGGTAKDEVPEVHINDDPKIPAIRPPFLSERHFSALDDIFNDEHPYNPAWMAAYYHGGAEEDDEADEVNFLGDESPAWVKRYNEFVLVNQVIVHSAWLSVLVTGAIIAAGILVGIQSYKQFGGNLGLAGCDLTVQCIFTCDVIFKLFQEGANIHVFWTGPDWAWNNFDFVIVAICWVPAGIIGNVNFLRLLRLLRLMKLVKKIKQLQVIAQGLMKGLNASLYIGMLMILIYYMFALVGVNLFHKNSPYEFGGIGQAMVNLFRIATFEAWTNVLYINYYGCDSMNSSVTGWYSGQGFTPVYVGGPVNHPHKEKSNYGLFYEPWCWRPRAQPVATAIYFVLWPLVGGYILTSFFIGAVTGAMSDALHEFKEEEEERRSIRVAKLTEKVDPNGLILLSLSDFFDKIDADGSGEVHADELAQALSKMGEVGVTLESAQAMIERVDTNKSGTLGFREFVIVMTNGKLDLDSMDALNAEADKSLGPAALSLKKQIEEDRADAAARAKLAVVRSLRRAWELDDEEKKELEAESRRAPIMGAYFKAGKIAEKIRNLSSFQFVMTCAICLAGALVGIETEQGVPGNVPHHRPVIDGLNDAILVIFSFEVVVKMLSEGRYPLNYFNDNWNCFDFVIVSLCDIFRLPFLPPVGNVLSMLRLLRLLRVLKLVKMLSQLNVIIVALIQGLSSFFFVFVILFIFFYVFAIIGVLIFANNDPAHFGNLQLSLLTLWRLATFDNWSDFLFINMYGCDKSSIYYFGRQYFGGGLNNVAGPKMRHKYNVAQSNCNHPYAWGWVAAAYLIFFCIIGGQVLLTLFIGVVAESMEEAKAEHDECKVREDRLARRANVLGIPIDGPVMKEYQNIFEQVAEGNTSLAREEIKPLVTCLPLVNKSFLQKSGKETQDLNITLTRLDIEQLFEVLAIMDTLFSDKGKVEFPEFVVVMDFMRRSIFERGVVEMFRRVMKATEEEGLLRKGTAGNSALDTVFVSAMAGARAGGDGWEAVEDTPLLEDDGSAAGIDYVPSGEDTYSTGVVRFVNGYAETVYPDSAAAAAANRVAPHHMRMLLDTERALLGVYRFARFDGAVKLASSADHALFNASKVPGKPKPHHLAHLSQEQIATLGSEDDIETLMVAVASADAKNSALEARVAELEEAMFHAK